MYQPNIILIVFDTLRKDVLPMYGGNAFTPNLNEFAKEAVVFPNPVAPSPWTLPSHVSLFSGLYPIEHGIHEYFNGSTNDFDLNYYYNGKTIVKTVRNKGYNTLALTANCVINPLTGLTDEFNYFKIEPFDYFIFEDIEFAKKFFENKKLNIKNVIKNYLNYSEYIKVIKCQKIYNYPSIKGANLIINDLFNKKMFHLAVPILFF